jgi:outer membrane protein W
MRAFLFAGTLAVTLAAAGSASADATPTGLEIGLRSGYAIPLGNSVGGAGNNSLSNTVNGVIPIWVDAGYRLNPNIYVGAFFQYGIGLVNSSAFVAQATTCGTVAVSCSANDLMFGVDAHYHFMPDGSFDPYAGIGVGYEILNLSASQGGNSFSLGLNGFQFVNLQLGADYKAMPNLGIGPFVMFSLGQYGNCSTSLGGTCTLPQTSMHEWLTLGVRGAYDINL